MSDEQIQALIDENKRLREALGALQLTSAAMLEDNARLTKAISEQGRLSLRQSILHQLLCSTLLYAMPTGERWACAEALYAEGVRRGIYPSEQPTGDER